MRVLSEAALVLVIVLEQLENPCGLGRSAVTGTNYEYVHEREHGQSAGGPAQIASCAAAARPARKPVAQAHWKLKPPIRPSQSSISPIR